MNLLFPQWQGAGERPALGDGAVRLASRRPDLPWVRLEPLPTPSFEPDRGIRARAQLTAQLEAALELLAERRPDTLFTVAGDCSAELAPIAWLAGCHPELTVVWLDAHADLQAPATSPSGDLHGMPLRLLLGEGDDDLIGRLPARLRPAQVLLAGVRAWDPAEAETAARLGLTKVAADAIDRDPDALLGALRRIGARKVYLHLDLDVLEPAEFGALGWPEAGGVGVAALTSALRSVHDAFEVVGGGLTEYLPTAGREGATEVARAVLHAWLP